MMNIKSIALLMVLAFAGAQATVVDTIAATPELSAVLEAASAVSPMACERMRSCQVA